MSFKPIARAIMRRLGTPITLSKTTMPVYDPVTGETTEGAKTAATQMADITAASKSKLNLEVQQGDLVATITAENFIPDLHTDVILNGTRYRVVFVNEVYAVKTLTLYEMQLRRIGDGE